MASWDWDNVVQMDQNVFNAGVEHGESYAQGNRCFSFLRLRFMLLKCIINFTETNSITQNQPNLVF
jgi:hypothetical protein